MGPGKSVTDSRCDVHIDRLRPWRAEFGIAVGLYSEADDVEVGRPNLSDADGASGGGCVENHAVSGVDAVVTGNHDDVTGARVGESDWFPHRPLCGRAVREFHTELGVDEQDKSGTVESGRVCATKPIGDSDVLFADLEHLRQTEIGVRRVLEIVGRRRPVVGREIDPSRRPQPIELRLAGRAESGLFDGECRATGCCQILGRFACRDYFGAERVGGQSYGPHESADQCEDGSSASSVTAHRGANDPADRRTCNPGDAGEETEGVADC